MHPDSISHNSSTSEAIRVHSRSPPQRPSDLESLTTTPPGELVDQSGPPSTHSAPLASQALGSDRRSWPTSSWGGETFAGFISATSLISFIVILAMWDGQPLSTWKFAFSLNTVVSILSTLFKTPLAYIVGSCVDQTKWIWFTKKDGPLSTFASIDEAGRGPMGSLLLLWLLGSGLFRSWVSIGAFVTIALLAVDPFLQSVVDYPGKLVSTDLHNAAIGIATSFHIGDWYIDGEMYLDRKTHEKIGTCVIPYQDRSMSATSMLGFIDGSTSRLSQPPLLSCATGNCTWTYSTLAICSRCEDVTSLITTETVEDRDATVFETCSFQSYTSNATDYLRYRVKGNYNLSLCAPDGILENQTSSHSSPGESGFGRTKKTFERAAKLMSYHVREAVGSGSSNSARISRRVTKAHEVLRRSLWSLCFEKEQ